ncbi:MAG: 1-deoxy-D-xylulose-5-phosphate synthase [Candidatus Brocadiae bacterium]|nr:1-deoxy-D-xylulose-5-phosphate synthase [Candidatus Brocadiia bacterium]
MTRILDTIDEPADLRHLDRRQLEALAQELREEILRVVLVNGGHLASNLGSVELTIALHRCFDFATDALVWDVGHQAYAHKLLTGRRDAFHTLRQQGGISGFPNRHESPYDPFTAGHAGTSISQAIGLVCADELLGRHRRVVAVIGDGSLTSGMALEALNYAGHLDKNLLVVLNDNKMSINATVGALSQHLDRLRTTRFYNEAKREVRRLVHRVPGVGEFLESALGHLKEGLKASILPENLFDQLGFRTFGPVDGHNLDDLMNGLEAVRHLAGPVLLHVVTEKGRGHPEAVSDPARYHSASPVPPCPVEPGPDERPEQPAYTQVFAEALCRMGAEDERLVAITAAMEAGTGLAEFGKRFPARFFDVGICEQHAVAFAAGLSASGCRPVVAIYSTFLQRGYDQVFHDLSLQDLDAVLCIDRAGLVGADGPTHHGAYDIAYLRHLPRVVLCAPKDGAELQAMLRYAVKARGTWGIRFPREGVPDRSAGGTAPIHTAPIEIGKAEPLRDGHDVAIVAYGAMVARALEAADQLAEQGIAAAVVNARFAKPVDTGLLAELAAAVPLLVTVEDHALAGGFGSAVLEALADARIDTPVERLGIPDRFIEHGARDTLLDGLGLSADGIAARVADALATLHVHTPREA